MQRDRTNLISSQLSQLAFNARVLQEAQDHSVPLLERLRFLGIFSNNQDEFYRVQVAALLRHIAVDAESSAGNERLLKRIQMRILSDQSIFLRTYAELLGELEREGIRIVTETELNDEQGEFVRDFFAERVRPRITPIMLRGGNRRLQLSDENIYLAVRVKRTSGRKDLHAIVDIPTRMAPRFVQLPGGGSTASIILLEDVIRRHLADIFSIFRIRRIEGWVVKLTRDAELDLLGGHKDSYLSQVEKSVNRRRTAPLVRFVYDQTIPPPLLRVLCRRLRVDDRTSFVPGGRHHNFKDFIAFPRIAPRLLYRPRPPLAIPRIDRERTVSLAIRRGDVLLQTPYQRFSYLIDLLREAAIDPKVTRIWLTMYRVAHQSGVVGALVNAARNGKRVNAVVELKARFDEASNIHLTDQLTQEGVNVLFGPEDLKVHAKVGLVERRERGRLTHQAFLGTGNMNEDTANVYADHFLLTGNAEICEDVLRLFRIIRRPYVEREFRRLLVSPWHLLREIGALIDAETERARRGEPASIEAKLNNLTEPAIIRRLEAAAAAGVEVRLMVRGMCSVPVDPGRYGGRIQARALIDQYLEHSRILIFGNGGDPLYFLGSSDWMPRSFHRRIEVTFPVLDDGIKARLRRYMDHHWADNTKARLHDPQGRNRRVPQVGEPISAQASIYEWLRSEAEDGVSEWEASGVEAWSVAAAAGGTRSGTRSTPRTPLPASPSAP